MKKKLLLFISFLISANTRGMMPTATDSLTEQLHCSIRGLNYHDIVHFLCEGADKNERVNGYNAFELLSRSSLRKLQTSSLLQFASVIMLVTFIFKAFNAPIIFILRLPVLEST